ncbi:MAG: bifunctional (p)ppGpp synthetase/guanosine-3',5'-bis(diphosphate) 3'-pyrophosphohydrolase [Bacteroidota bacterium]
MIQDTMIRQAIEQEIEPPFREKLDDLIKHAKANNPDTDRPFIERAFRVAYWAHRDVQRASGEPYITHPLEVATIVAHDIGFDDMCIAAALMHDVVEDTEIGLDYIAANFGDTMASIIDGLTKIRDVFESREIGQAANVQKLMLSMASDFRVILVKFADRLHNMRTIEALPERKRLKIARETLDLFAPLAHRFGLFAVKSEMEDLCLRVLDLEVYYRIVEGLQASKSEREAYVKSFIDPMREHLERVGFAFQIYGRSKNIYSIYRKMKRQNKPIEEIYDLFAIRIVMEREGRKGKEDCWRAYSIVTDLYPPLPERFRDFISVPKSNGYQSLHTTVLGPAGRRVEVQIRTREMHDVAERGLAAHWKYKEGVEHADPQFERWLEWARELLDNPRPEEATDFLKEFKLQLYEDEIYVFTPRGDLMNLPQGATPVDFAFQVHTEVGLHCIGAKVNGRMVPLSYRLTSGDQVEIITSKKQVPSRDWMSFVVTHKAQSRIRHWLNEKRRKAVELGRELWIKKARKASLEIDEQMMHGYASKLKFPDVQQLYYEIGSALYDPDKLVELIKRGEADRLEEEQAAQEALRIEYESFLDTAQSAGSPALLIDGELHTDVVTKYASCCNPIPGDNVFGFISRSGNIKIHRVNCKNAPHLLVNQADRIVPVEWSRQKDVQFIAGLRIMGEDRVGIVSDITTVISKNLKTNIRSITVDSDDGIFEGTLVIYVSDLAHLRRLIDRLKRVEGIYGVYRFEE